MKKKIALILIATSLLTSCANKEAETESTTEGIKSTTEETLESSIETSSETLESTKIESETIELESETIELESETIELESETEEIVTRTSLTSDELKTMINDILENNNGYKLECSQETILDNLTKEVGEDNEEFFNELYRNAQGGIASYSEYSVDNTVKDSITFEVSEEAFHIRLAEKLNVWQSGDDIYINSYKEKSDNIEITDSYIHGKTFEINDEYIRESIGIDTDKFHQSVINSIGDINSVIKLDDKRYAFSSFIGENKEDLNIGIATLKDNNSLADISFCLIMSDSLDGIVSDEIDTLDATVHLTQLEDELTIPEDVVNNVKLNIDTNNLDEAVAFFDFIKTEFVYYMTSENIISYGIYPMRLLIHSN